MHTPTGPDFLCGPAALLPPAEVKNVLAWMVPEVGGDPWTAFKRGLSMYVPWQCWLAAFTVPFG